MKSKVTMLMCMMMPAAVSQAYLIQNVDLALDAWVGDGDKECVIAIDWNGTTGPYATAYHLFGYRWDGDKTVADALTDLDAAIEALTITYNYDWGFVEDIVYDQAAMDGDSHTAGEYHGWWWLGDTADGGQTWTDNGGAMTVEYLWDGGIEALSVDNGNWGSANMTIPEPATMVLLAAGLLLAGKRK